jgi:hypothetical protein
MYSPSPILGFQCRNIGSGIRFGNSDGADHVTGDGRFQIGVLEIIRSELVNGRCGLLAFFPRDTLIKILSASGLGSAYGAIS